MNAPQVLNDELMHRIALMKVPKIGGQTAKNLVTHCGSACEVFKKPIRELVKIGGIGTTVASQIAKLNADPELWHWAAKEIAFIEKNHIKILCYDEPNYPHRLKQMEDGPFLLYQHGETDLNAQRMVAIVGTRKPSRYGIQMTEKIIDEMSGYNPLIVSGLAYGIDATAHRRALTNELKTVGVMGAGLQRIYPSDHTDLAQQMTENGGGLLTEFRSDQSPDREHFPMRNRIIAGLCDAMIVVESPVRGGSMISATFATDYNRDLFAVPARVGDPQSEGCNALIKVQRAQLIESGEDVAYLLRWDELNKAQRPSQSQLFLDLTDQQQAIVAVLQENKQISIDQLSIQTAKKSGELASILLELEFLGVIKALPGKQFALVRR